MQQRTATRARLSRLLAFMWLREMFARNPETDVALVPYQSDGPPAVMSPETAEAIAIRNEVDACTPAVPQWHIERPRAASVNPVAFAILAAGVAAGVGVAISQSEQTCTFPDGTRVAGQCIFDDEFTSFNSAAWNAEDNWNGPLQAISPDVSCFRHENVSVSGGALNLDFTANARGSCPQTWTATSRYNPLYGASGSFGHWAPGGATSYDTAVVSMKTCRATYGHWQIKVLMPPGSGPGGDITMWGANCQRSAGVIDALMDLFLYNPGSRACDWPNAGSQEMDIFQSAKAGGTTTVNTSVYVASSPGSPTEITASPFFDIHYYGARYAQPTTGGFKTWLGGTIANPTGAYHLVDIEWNANLWRVSVDNVKVAEEAPGTGGWIPNTPMFMMIWNAATVAVTPGDLPSRMSVDWVRGWCPPGWGCTWSGCE